MLIILLNQRHNNEGRNRNGNGNHNNNRFQNEGNRKRDQAQPEWTPTPATLTPTNRKTNVPAVNVFKDDYGSSNDHHQSQSQEYDYYGSNNNANDEYTDINEDTVSYDTNYDSGNNY